MEDENKSVETPEKPKRVWEAWHVIVIVVAMVIAVWAGFAAGEYVGENNQDVYLAKLDEKQTELERYGTAVANLKAQVQELTEEKNALLGNQETEEPETEPEPKEEPEPEPEPSYDTNAQDTCSAGDLDETETSSSASDEIIVYVTRTGEKYHRESCSYLRQSKIETTLSEAVEDGYTPCSRCHPPTE